MCCTYVQYSNHLPAGEKNYILSGYKNEMNRRVFVPCVIFRWIVFPFDVSVWFVMGVVNCLSYILKGRDKWKKLIHFILF